MSIAIAHVVLAAALAGVVVLVLRSMSALPPPAPAAFVQRNLDGVPIERLAPLVAKAVPVERYLPSPAPAPALEVSLAVASSVPVTLATKPLSEPSKIKPRKKLRQQRAQAERDDPGPAICRGRGRIWINGGRSWRCRRT
jgi:hypothetical protein